jgi:hypothetical protein
VSEGEEEEGLPLEVEQIESAPLGRAKVAIRVTGRWLARRWMPDARAFLVVEADGRRHRFPAMPEPRRSRLARSAAWSASFALPTWLEPKLGRGMSLWFGNVEIPLAEVAIASRRSADEQAAPFAAGAGTVEAELAENPPPAEADLESGEESLPAPEPAAAAPEPAADPDPEPTFLAARDELDPHPVAYRASAPAHGDTITALRAELQQRAAVEAQLRGQLAATKAEVEVRIAHQAELDETFAELRAELDKLLALVEQESARRAEVESRAVVLAAENAELQERVADLTTARDETAAEAEGLRAELAASDVGREAAVSEAAGLREELDRLGAELAQARGIGAGNGLSEAQALLLEARAITARLRERTVQASQR